jgi:mono/diheme cytochrome c family protein
MSLRIFRLCPGRLVGLLSLVWAAPGLVLAQAARPVPPARAVPAFRPPPQPVFRPRPQVQGLAFDSEFKRYTAKAGETSAHLSFGVTNIASTNITILFVSTSCGCTVARLPSQPWTLTPGASGQIEVTVDLRGKWGVLQKFITVQTSHGFRSLRVQVTIPGGQPVPFFMGDRARNMALARADRQAVFRGSCARCHVAPTVGKTGRALYQAACGICHEAVQRATMVPDLHALRQPTDRAFWKNWVASGKPGTLMPAFAKAHGGPLGDAQIESLVDYLTTQFRPRAAAVPLARRPPAFTGPTPPLPPLPHAPPSRPPGAP